eukprot:TRINITY_DN607_c0_g1_i11.p1 TRINITY_DN607_c0_g1~~TRINITY_DN607_c0_g1_i11.p1  ORF type:complete len:545 (-),score=135.41 TRINITY_DN607_c0_g1_i11:382-2016(-)
MAEFDFESELESFPAGELSVRTYKGATKESESPKAASSPQIAEGEEDTTAKIDAHMADVDGDMVFKGKTVFLAFSADGNEELSGIKSKLQSLGAKVAPKISKQVNYVIYSKGKKEFFAQARKSSIPIVNPAWTERCAEEKKIIETDEYLVSSQAILSQPESKSKDEDGKDAVAEPAEKTAKKSRLSSKKAKANENKEKTGESEDSSLIEKKDAQQEEPQETLDVSSKPAEKTNESGKSRKRGLGKSTKSDKESADAAEPKESADTKAAKKSKSKSPKSSKPSTKTKQSRSAAKKSPSKKKSEEGEASAGEDSDGDDEFRDSQLSDESSEDSAGHHYVPAATSKSGRKSAPVAQAKSSEPVIAISGLDQQEKTLFYSVAKSLGGKICEGIDDHTTHLVSGPKRTIKTLFAAARGLWVLQPSWLYSSLEAGKWAPESEHEVEFMPGPKISRAHKEKGGAGLLSGKYVFILGETTPEPSVLEDLVMACDGEIAEYVEQCKLCIAASGVPIPAEFTGVAVVNEKFLLDSIAQGTLQRPEDYAVAGGAQ